MHQSRPPDKPGKKMPAAKRRWALPVRGLSAKLLILTVIFVMIAEVLIFVPSIANFRNVWLRNHLSTAEAASIVYLDSKEFMLSPEAGVELLKATQSIAVAVRQGQMRQLMASSSMPGDVAEHIDLDNVTAFGSIRSALGMLFAYDEDHYRVFGSFRSRDAIMELVQPIKPIKQAMWIYARNVLLLSLAISVITAGLVYFALYLLIVRPIIRISANMDAFSKSPEDASLIYRPTGRDDELGITEERLAAFETDLQQTLRQKQHLADLGLAVSKINHDLRNILASAQLFSDRLTSLPDPTVQRFAPKLIRTIDRAIDYTKSVLTYGKAVETPPNRRALLLRPMVGEVAELLGLENSSSITWQNAVDDEFEVVADSEQLFRVLMNLCRNAQQVMLEMDNPDRELIVRVTAERTDDGNCIQVADRGPGISEKVRETLFEAFKGSTRAGGTGLGMAIASEIIRAHSGTIEIQETSPNGTIISLTLPHSVVVGEIEIDRNIAAK